VSQVLIYDANAYLRRSLSNTLDPVNTSPRFTYEAANACAWPQIWVWDGVNNNERRRKLLPGYKIRDQTMGENIFAGLQIYRQLLAHSRATQIEVPEWEADDVCGTLAMHFAAKGVRSQIFTNDFDYHQLEVNTHIKVRGVKPKEGVEPRFVPLYKTLVGDKSDKIDGIPNFGHKSYEVLAPYHEQLDHALQYGDAAAIRAVPFKPASRIWLSSDENLELLFVYYRITWMWDVPLDLIEQHTKPGVFNPAAAQALFDRFIL